MIINASEAVMEDPVIVVGPGRSGTTLLGSVLGEHPDFYMVGENMFLLHRLWKTFFEYPHYVNARKITLLAQRQRPDWRDMPWWTFLDVVKQRQDDVRLLLEDMEHQEEGRVAREMGRAFARLLIPETLRKKRWGFADIWLGSDSFQFDPMLYEMCFPNATYVQCIRHPFAYVNSAMNGMDVEFTDGNIVYNLIQWLKMVDSARQFKSRSKYIEFRLEDFVNVDSGKADEVFRTLELEMTEKCKQTLKLRHSRSRNESSPPMDKFVCQVPSLEDRMQELGYSDSV